MKKQEAQQQLIKLQNEIDKLKIIINSPTNLFETIRNYSDVCIELGIKEKTNSDFDSLKEFRYHQIQNIAKLFNGDSINNYYYPYFNRSGSGLVFYRSAGGAGVSYFSGQVAYYKDRQTSDFVGKLFVNIYNDLK